MAKNAQHNQYRDLLNDLETAAQAEYDRLIVVLSGGALGVSFAFVHQFVGDAHPVIWPTGLVAAWTCWVFSLASMLLSHWFSAAAMRAAIEQIDSGERMRPGIHASAVKILNIAAGALFIAGALITVWFVSLNVR
jgi:hypothetical protein